jgi:hypothetical protein
LYELRRAALYAAHEVLSDAAAKRIQHRENISICLCILHRSYVTQNQFQLGRPIYNVAHCVSNRRKTILG